MGSAAVAWHQPTGMNAVECAYTRRPRQSMRITAVPASILPNDVQGDLRGQLWIVQLLQDVERSLGKHRADERLAVPRRRDATEPAVRVGAGADQGGVTDAAGPLPLRSRPSRRPR